MSSNDAQPAPPPPPQVKCPSCGQLTVYAPSNPYRPFCSQRCKNMDLGAWASEQFRVDAVEGPDDEQDDAASSAGSPPPDWRH